MAKYYIKCGTLELIYSTSKNPMDAAVTALYETNKFDILDEHFYIDERGMYDYSTAKPDTTVIPLKKVAKKGGWTLGR
jgi:hypothetical protein